MRRGLLVVLLAGVVAAVWTAVGSQAGTKHESSGASVTISNAQGQTWTCGFNPFNANDYSTSFGTVYEELVFVNALKSGQAVPWLAKSYAWSNHSRTLTFTIRSGVKWTDGTPLTAADVLFTFQLIKKYGALDLNAVWSVLKSVSQNGDKITFKFKTAAVPYFFYVAGQTPIVPKHVWSKISNPVTYKDTKPVATGPYTVSSCSPQNIRYAKNPHYWFPPVVNVSIFMNLKNPILKNVAVRRAMAYAIDRSRVSRIGEYGYEPAANQTGIVTPTFKSWLDKKLAKRFSYDPKKAKQILTKAGFKFSNGVFHTKAGKPLAFQMVNISGYTDWIASAQIVAQNLKAIGIKVTPVNESQTTYNSDTYFGHYQLAYDGNNAGGPAPYYELRQELYSKNSAPIGKSASSNWERYSNKQVDKLINAYAGTTSLAKQHSIVDKLEAAMVRDVPIIPITEGVDWYQYNTKSLTGWVTPKNPYASPAAYSLPDWGVLLLHLRPKG